MTFQKGLQLTDVVNPQEWQGIQNSLSEVLEVRLRTFSPEGKLISKTSRSNHLCDEIFPKIAKTKQFCSVLTVGSEIPGLDQIKRDTGFKCPFGVDIFVIPIKAIGEKIAAYVVLGPVILRARRDRAEYEKEAASYELDSDKLFDALIDINVFTYNKIDAMMTVVKDVFSNIAQTGYHKKRLGEIAPEVVEVDPLFAKYYEEKILSALLNICTLALSADSGSVMIIDRKTNLLHIKAASQLSEDVVKKSELKMGEGIAGAAAAKSEPLILPKDEKKIGKSGKMQREYIKSSMIVPFNKANDPNVYGVINLNITRKGREFSEKDIAFVKELIGLASIALLPIK